MVSIAALGGATSQLTQGLSPDDCVRVEAALAYASEAYQGKVCTSGQNALDFALGVANTLAFLRSDAETRIAGLMFELTVIDPKAKWTIDKTASKSKSRNTPFHGTQVVGRAVATIVGGAIKMTRLG